MTVFNSKDCESIEMNKFVNFVFAKFLMSNESNFSQIINFRSMLVDIFVTKRRLDLFVFDFDISVDNFISNVKKFLSFLLSFERTFAVFHHVLVDVPDA